MKQNNKVAFGKIKNIFICMGLALFLVGVAMPSGLSHARGRVKPEMVLPDHYPYGFDGMGRILRITRDEVVIDDNLFALSPDLVYHTLDIKDASSAFFRPGNKVGYLMDSEEKITSLWLLE